MPKGSLILAFCALVVLGFGFIFGRALSVHEHELQMELAESKGTISVIDLSLVKDAYKAELERVTGKTYTAKVVRLEGMPNAKVELEAK